MTNRRRNVLASIAMMVAATVARADELRSPFAKANAIQQQMRLVTARAARATFAVTAFATPPTEARFYSGPLDGATFARLADALPRGCGTAFAIDESGTLLTSEHVISRSKSVWVTRDDGRVLPAIVVGSDPRSDLAILRVPAETTPLAIANDAPQRGDVALTLGNPAGLSTSGGLAASVGTISAINRSLPELSAREKRFYDDLLQVTTPLSVGNSGGPLVDLAGDAVGVMCATTDGTGDSASVGYAVALTAAQRERLAKLERGEEIEYGYFGVSLSGGRVQRVDNSAPAAGILMPGDVVRQFDGVAIESDASFWKLTAATRVGRVVPIVVERDHQTLSFALAAARFGPAIAPVTRATQTLTWAGVTFANDDACVRVAGVADGAKSPFAIGSKVRAINGEATATLSDLVRVLHTSAGEALNVELDPG